MREMRDTLIVLNGRMSKQLYEFEEIKAEQQETFSLLIRTLPRQDAALAKAAVLRAKRAALRKERQALLDQLADIGRQLQQLRQTMEGTP